MIFYLGTHKPCWLARTDVPLFVSRRTLAKYRTAPVALGPWALDSGGFSELSLHGKWTITVRQYIREVCLWLDRPGNLQWAAPMDWMCEPFITAKTGLSVEEHQKRTVDNYLELDYLMRGASPFIPVLQGWTPDDYLRCAEMYEEAGVRLAGLPLVGVGSVCRRQGTEEALEVLRPLHGLGLRLHGFGFKVEGFRRGAASLLASADSMAWSKRARNEPPLEGCTHASCANCMRYALRWRLEVLEAIKHGEREYQPVLFC